MKKILLVTLIVFSAFGLAYWDTFVRVAPVTAPNDGGGLIEEPQPDPLPQPDPTRVSLDVPYVNEAPENIWTGSWKNACEEATIAMVDKYYAGVKTVSVPEAKVYLQALFDFQKREYGSDANSDAARTLEIIKSEADFDGRVVTNPTIEQIKEELRAGRPIIGFHRGFDLQNKNIPFLRTGSSYHTTVIKGFDDMAGHFITHDPGDSKEGADHVYEYELYMNSLHDYRYTTGLADGPPRVIFTFTKPSN